MRRFYLPGLLLCAATALQSAPWTRINSPNFELYTTSPEEDGRSTLEAFEQARNFFLSAKLFPVPPAMPVVVVAFATAKEYKPYSAKQFDTAYFIGDEQRDYVVMSDLGTERTRVAVHEYVHVLVRHSGLDLPLWLNEGMAEVYSGMETKNGKVLLGKIPDDRAYLLGSGNWMRIGKLVAVRPDSPEYNERDRTGMFYAQSCVLTHMLMLSDEYAGKFATFLERLLMYKSEQKALAEVYGKSLAEVEKDMLAYFRQSMSGGASYKAPAHTANIEPTREATPLEVDLMLAKLTGMLGRFDEAQSRLTRLSAENPGRREIEEAQAYLLWRTGDPQGAIRAFQQLLASGAGSWKTYWDYARLLHVTHGEREQKMEALRQALERKPEFGRARLMLAEALYTSGRLRDALSQLKQIGDVEPRDAVGMYWLMAHASLGLNEREEARLYASDARRHARLPEDIARTNAFLTRLDATPLSVDATPAPNDEGERPVIRRRAPPKPSGPSRRKP